VQHRASNVKGCIQLPIVNRESPLRQRWAPAGLFFLDGTGFGVWAAHIAAFKQRLNLHDSQITAVLFSVILGALLCMPLVGQLIARTRVRLVATLSVVGYVLTLWLLGHASHLFSLCGLAFLFGAAKGSVDVSINTQAVALDRPGHRSQMSFFQGCWSVGGLAGSGVSALLLRHGGTVSKDMSAATMLLAVLAAAALPFLPSEGVAAPGRPQPTWPSPYLLLLGTLAFFGLLVEGAIADWTSVFLHSNLQLSLALSATGFGLYAIAMAATRFTGDWLAEQISGKWLLIVSGLLIVVGIGSLLSCKSWHIAALGLMFAGFGTANIVPVLWSAAGRDPVIGPGPAISIVSTIGYLGFLAGPPMIGGAASFIGLRAGMGIIVIAGLMVAILSARYRVGEQSLGGAH
jgi:MFS family permease